jgi:hypothetical protein
MLANFSSVKFIKIIAIIWCIGTSTAAAADMEKATNAYKNGDYGTAFSEFMELANSNNATAQRYLGFMRI